MATGIIPGKEVVAYPWFHSSLVAAEVLEGSRYDPDGDEEILYPLATSRGTGWRPG
jgi:hypothetical protein